MVVELKNIFNNEGESVLLDYSLSMEDVEWNGGQPFQSPVQISGSIKNEVGIVRLRAVASFCLATVCDRCASDIQREMQVPMDHILVTELNHEENNDDYLLIEDGKLDLDDLARTDVLLELPSKILCAENCKGLCPQCGQNRNEGACTCQKPIDPRLEALKQLFNQDLDSDIK